MSAYSFLVYKIWRGPLHEEDTSEVEWVQRPYMNTSHKRLYLSVPTAEGNNNDEEDEEAGATKKAKRS